MKITTFVMTFCGIATAIVAAPYRSEAGVYAAQLYPYCQITSNNGGGMNCYISSRDQCEFRELCVDNPWYLGAQSARAWKRKNKPEWRWW
jgi:hypothetical protein